MMIHPEDEDEPRCPTPTMMVIDLEDEEPRCPTTPMWVLDLEDDEPPCPTPPEVSPKAYVFESDTEEWQSVEEEEQNSQDDVLAAFNRTSNLLAEIALKHYNNNEKNKVKYELINVTKRCQIVDGFTGYNFYHHLNFIAKGNQQNPKEELFFAELLTWNHGLQIHKASCVVSLEGDKLGALCGTRGRDLPSDEKDFPLDNKHCYACVERLMHPKNEQFEAGHVASHDYYRNLLC